MFFRLAVGHGAYGIVVSANDSAATMEEFAQVAIKRIDKTFQNALFAKRTLRELKFLRLIDHENIIPLLTIQRPEKKESLNAL